MTEDWNDIDQGWEDVDIDKKKRTRARGKKRRTTSAQPAQRKQPRKKPKTHQHAPTGDDMAAKDKKAGSRPWLLPVIGFVLVLGLLVAALVASKR